MLVYSERIFGQQANKPNIEPIENGLSVDISFCSNQRQGKHERYLESSSFTQMQITTSVCFREEAFPYKIIFSSLLSILQSRDRPKIFLTLSNDISVANRFQLVTQFQFFSTINLHSVTKCTGSGLTESKRNRNILRNHTIGGWSYEETVL